MRVFVAGATGVAGRRAVARLVAAGHEVTGVSRSPEKDGAARVARRARRSRVDLFDADALRVAVAGHDAVVNLATKIPPLDADARGRARGTRTSASAARRRATSSTPRSRRARRCSCRSRSRSCTASTATSGSTRDRRPHGRRRRSPARSQAAEANVARFTEQGGRGVVLRFGRFYAPESDQTQAMVQRGRRGMLLDLGRADCYAPMIDADDVASAVVAALDAPAGVYDIVDDEPLHPRRAGARARRRRSGGAGCGACPTWMTPEDARATSRRRNGCRTGAFREATGWRPASPSVRVGLSASSSRRDAHRAGAARPWSRLMLWILAFSAFGVGVQAAFFPRSFYDDFPFGRGWVAMDGRYNEHLIRDVGALNLALLVVTDRRARRRARARSPHRRGRRGSCTRCRTSCITCGI